MKKLIPILLIVLTTGSLKAQETIFQLNWDIAFPMNELQDFTDNTSARGISMGGRKFIYDFFSVGGKLGWQTFNDRFSGTMQIDDNYTLTGTQIRFVNAFPIMANFHFYLGPDEGIRPYIGSNVGLSIIHQRLDVGLFTAEETTTHFAIAPEVGVLIPIGIAGGGIVISGKYEQAFKTQDTDNIQYFSVSIGLLFAN